ncbi:hypothetical protein BHE74_00002812 [Ensete ventricosum]|nr:hypothetical protein BHE74_00002812 [Ensete ventricosum]RZS05787.1 hypothetical protein BHM03_00036341 [Ensete ventricosum]
MKAFLSEISTPKSSWSRRRTAVVVVERSDAHRNPRSRSASSASDIMYLPSLLTPSSHTPLSLPAVLYPPLGFRQKVNGPLSVFSFPAHPQLCELSPRSLPSTATVGSQNPDCGDSESDWKGEGKWELSRAPRRSIEHGIGLVTGADALASLSVSLRNRSGRVALVAPRSERSSGPGGLGVFD